MPDSEDRVRALQALALARGNELERRLKLGPHATRPLVFERFLTRNKPDQFDQLVTAIKLATLLRRINCWHRQADANNACEMCGAFSFAKLDDAE
jgi:hypothetical protein